ncbi:MAG TPA: glycerophosphodiester phosphodiesterase family protein [Bryobacteraceae bacterium]|nr:glycerophosphodiester phosphodiesterase family protein [Bryobacteraceae bacterium]
MKILLLSLLFLAAAVAGTRPVAVHAHRGATAVRPENTIAAFQEAIRIGADFIELDVLATSDDVLVVTHDPVINPALCTGGEPRLPIRQLSLAEVRRYDCGSLTLPAFPHQVAVPGARIPTLNEVLDLAKTSKIRFNIEIKSSEKWKGWAPDPEPLARMVVDAVREHGLEKRVLIQSFDFRVVRAVKAVAPEIPLAALYGGGERSFVDIARETGVRMVNPAFRLITPEKVKEAHAAGIQVIPWTIDNPADWDRVLAAGVDGIISNDPAAAIAHLRTKGLR